MKIPELNTPIYIKRDKDMPWPKDKMFYILSADGLLLCRNHEWFKSASVVKGGPSELENQTPFVEVNFPRIPGLLIGKAVSFFRAIEKEHHWESALLLVYDRQVEQVGLICPDQKASGFNVKYEIPNLPVHLSLIGDIHSHCDFSPHPSLIDENDESHRPGLHIVAGYINRELPLFHVDVVVDGFRFTVTDHPTVMEDCLKGNWDFPADWLKQVKPENKSYWGGNDYGGGAGYKPNMEPPKSKKELCAVDDVLDEFMMEKTCPSKYAVTQKLFNQTSLTGYGWCEQMAEQFVKEWKVVHREK
jgi:proteasome lid subunit RPN8/RPN11